MANKKLKKSKLAELRSSRWSEADARLVLSAVERSGHTIHTFAREHDLKAHRIYWWRTRLAELVREEPADLEQLSFAPVVVTGLGRTPAVIVRAGEVEVEVFDPQRVESTWLAQVLAVTKGVE